MGRAAGTKRHIMKRIGKIFFSCGLLLGLLGLGGHAQAQGGPPMISDDPDTPGNGKWENNIALMLDTTPDGRVIQTPNVDLNYGLGERIQLNYQSGIVSQDVPGLPRDTGLTQELFGMKYRFVDAKNEKEGVSVSTYPKFAFRGPLSSASRDLTPADPLWQIPFQVKIAMGEVAITNEIGRTFSNVTPSGWFYGSVLGFSPAEHLDVMVEIHGESDTLPRQDDWLVNLGGRMAVSERLDVIAAMGRFIKTIGPAPEALGYAGVTLHM